MAPADASPLSPPSLPHPVSPLLHSAPLFARSFVWFLSLSLHFFPITVYFFFLALSCRNFEQYRVCSCKVGPANFCCAFSRTYKRMRLFFRDHQCVLPCATSRAGGTRTREVKSAGRERALERSCGPLMTAHAQHE